MPKEFQIDEEKVFQLISGLDCPNGCGGKIVIYDMAWKKEVKAICYHCGFVIDPKTVKLILEEKVKDNTDSSNGRMVGSEPTNRSPNL